VTGGVVWLERAEFERWLSGGATGMSMAELGESLFQRFGCAACHRTNGTSQGPSLVGLFGKTVELQQGMTVTADENYIRESIIDPRAKIVVGYQPIMPTFNGLVSEEAILQIIAYIKSLSAPERKPAQR